MEVIIMARPKRNKVQLSDADVKKLKGILKNKDTSQTIANRCRILLALDENHPPVQTYDQCMDLFCVSRATISNVAKTFVRHLSGMAWMQCLRSNGTSIPTMPAVKLTGVWKQELSKSPADRFRKAIPGGQSGFLRIRQK